MANNGYIYFMKDSHARLGVDGIRIGGSDKSKNRIKSHLHDGLEFLAGRPGTYGRSTDTDEWNLQQYFKDALIPGWDQSTFEVEAVIPYLTWLIRSQMAVIEPSDLEHCPEGIYGHWSPEKMKEGVSDQYGEASLFPEMGASPRERIVLASELPWLASVSDEWYTPSWIIDLAREALGGRIDTDPASNPAAQRYIQADRYYSRIFSGISIDHPWTGRVWLNPPYGTGEESASAFTSRLLRELAEGRVTTAITCLNLASISAKWFSPIWSQASSHLIWSGRINFGNPNQQEKPSAPSKGTILSYFGSSPEKFDKLFAPHGQVLRTPEKVMALAR